MPTQVTPVEHIQLEEAGVNGNQPSAQLELFACWCSALNEGMNLEIPLKEATRWMVYRGHSIPHSLSSGPIANLLGGFCSRLAPTFLEPPEIPERRSTVRSLSDLVGFLLSKQVSWQLVCHGTQKGGKSPRESLKRMGVWLLVHLASSHFLGCLIHVRLQW